MKKLMDTILVSLTVGLTIFFSALSLSAQCVVCTPAPPGWICTNGGQGGSACSIDGAICSQISPCVDCQGVDCPEGLSGKSNCNVTKGDKIKIEIKDETVREIGKLYPSLAIALVGLRKLPPLSYSEVRISVASVQLNYQDVESHLKPEQETKEYFDNLKSEVSKSFRNGKVSTVYDFLVDKKPDTNNSTLIIKTANGTATDLSNLTLEIDLTVKDIGIKGDSSEIRHFESALWRIN